MEPQNQSIVPDADRGGHKETDIIVNARRRVVHGNTVTFEEVVRLAFPDAPHDPNTVFTVTYRGAVSKPTSGELAAGGQVKVKKGTIFNVTKTTKS